MTERTTTAPDTAILAGMVEIERLRRENDQLRQLLEKAIPAVAGRVRHLRSLNDPRSLQLTDDLADMKAALQEDRDDT